MTTEFRIRPYGPRDLEQCRQLWEELTQHHRDIYNDPDIGGDSPGRMFDAHLARVGPGRLWVAESDRITVGLVGLIIDGQEAEVEPVIVATGYRAQGIGRALVNRAISEANQLGIRYLSVRPVARNARAISFFFAAGFDTLGHIEMFMDLKDHSPDAWKLGLELFGHPFKD